MKHFATAFALVAGITLAVHGSINTLPASAASKGGLVDSTILIQETPHAAAAVTQQFTHAYAAQQFIVGMLFILLGFFLHAFFVSREDRSVPVREVKRQEKPQIVYRKEWIFMNMQV